MNKKIAITQSNYIPWKGYIDSLKEQKEKNRILSLSYFVKDTKYKKKLEE